MNLFEALSTLGIALVAAGWALRRRSLRAHVALMLSAALVDYAVLVGIEVTRPAAVAASLRAPTALLAFHIAVSMGALLCYPALVWLGFSSQGARPDRLPLHRKVGRAFLVLRTLNYLTSWAV